MDTNRFPTPVSGRILLLISPDTMVDHLFDLVAQLALKGPLYVLDGGNIFQGYLLARVLRRQTPDISKPMQRVLLSRAFTCYQMEALLSEGKFEPCPVLVLDLLETFYDQGVRVPERRRLMRGCIERLKTLAHRAPVAVAVRQRLSVPREALGFLGMIQEASGQVWLPPRPSPLARLKQAALKKKDG